MVANLYERAHLNAASVNGNRLSVRTTVKLLVDMGASKRVKRINKYNYPNLRDLD